MDESFIWIIFVIIWVVSTIVKIIAKKSKNTPADKKGSPSKGNPVFGKLQNTINTFLAKLEQPSGATINRKIEQQSVETPQSEVIDLPEIKIQPVEKIHAYSITKSGPKRTYSSKRLKEAIVWSEILGKPVSMRDQ